MDNSAVPVLELGVPQAPPLRMEEDVIRVGESRVSLDTVVAGFNEGDTPEEIARNYDVLSLAEVYQVIGYYLSHQSEIDQYLRRRSAERSELQRQIEHQQKPAGIRQRLLARRERQL
jgi:uncharacterized protein (DUF433 family)